MQEVREKNSIMLHFIVSRCYKLHKQFLMNHGLKTILKMKDVKIQIKIL